MKFFDFFKSKWEILGRENNLVYLDGEVVGVETYTTKRHKVTGEIKITWVPAI